MSNPQSRNIFAGAIKGLIKNLITIFFMLFAWIFKTIGLVTTKFGEALERIIIKRS